MICPESTRKTCSDHVAGHVSVYRNEFHRQATNSDVFNSRGSWPAGSLHASPHSAFGCAQQSSATSPKQVHTAQKPGVYSTPASPTKCSRQLDACSGVGAKSEICRTSFQGSVQESVYVDIELLKHEQHRAITNLTANISSKLYVLEWTLNELAKSQGNVESRLSALETETQGGAEDVAKEKRLAGIDERLAELHELVVQNHTETKMKADFEHRLCDLETQIGRISLPELKEGQFKDTSNTLAIESDIESDSVAGMLATSNLHSTDGHKSNGNFSDIFANRLHALETNVDLMASILTRMDDRGPLKHAEELSDDVEVTAHFRNIRRLLEEAMVGADAEPHALSRSCQFQETGSTCFPIAEDV